MAMAVSTGTRILIREKGFILVSDQTSKLSQS
jgi:hypothetical protein